MTKDIRKVSYVVLQTDDMPGEGARLLKLLKKHKVKLLAITAFPLDKGSQVDLVPEDMDRLLAIEERLPWRLSRQKTGFLVQSRNDTGALVPVFEQLSGAGINVTAIDAVASGKNRYGAIFWVKPKDVAKATKVLGAT